MVKRENEVHVYRVNWVWHSLQIVHVNSEGDIVFVYRLFSHTVISLTAFHTPFQLYTGWVVISLDTVEFFSILPQMRWRKIPPVIAVDIYTTSLYVVFLCKFADVQCQMKTYHHFKGLVADVFTVL